MKKHTVEEARGLVSDFIAADESPIYIGIDPGAEGAIGLLSSAFCGVIDIPTFTVERKSTKTIKKKTATKTEFNCSGIVQIFRMLDAARARIRLVLLEQAQVQRKGKGANAYTGFRVGVGFGIWPLFLAEKGYPVEEVHPLTWKAALGLRGEDKEYARKKALSLFPEASLQRKSDHNRAEALLLAVYAERRDRGEEKKSC